MSSKLLLAAVAGISLIVSTQAFAGWASSQGTKPGETLNKCSDMVPANHPGLHGAALTAEYTKCQADRKNYK